MRAGLCLAAALAAGIAGAAAAGAADLVVRGFGGFAFEPTIDGDSSGPAAGDFKADHETGGVAGAAVGLAFRDYTLDIEAAYRTASVDELTFRGVKTEPDADTDIVSYIANAWYRVPLTYAMNGYLGGGIGAAKSESDFYGASYDTDFAFAWQIGAGLAYQLNDLLSVGVGYRYFNVAGLFDDTVALGSLFPLDGDYTDNSVIAELALRF